MKTYYDKKEYRNPNLNFYVKMKEGVSAVDEAIDFLQKQEPVSQLIHQDSLD